MKKLLVSFSFILSLNIIQAQIGISAGQTIIEDFNTMSVSATATLLAGWKVDIQNDKRENGSYAAAGNKTTRLGSANMTANVRSGIYNFGAGASDTGTSDRCVGGLNDAGAESVNVFLCLKNNGTTDISGFVISFDVEKYKRGTNSSGYTVQLFYSIDDRLWRSTSTNLRVSFLADTTNEGYSTVPGDVRSITAQTLPVSIPAGEKLYLSWNCSPISGSSSANGQALGIDNIIIKALGSNSAPASLTASNSGKFENTCLNKSSDLNSFILVGTNLDNTPITIGPLPGYTFSTSPTEQFFDKLTLFYSGSEFNKTIYVRFTPTEIKSYNGNISVSGGGALPITIPVTGAGANLPPNISSGNTSGITTATAMINGKIIDTGCSSITTYGIEYSTNSNFTNAIKTTSSNLANNNFSSSISGLSADTKYYYRAYATNSNGTAYGNQQTFTTLAEVIPPSLTASTVTDFGNNCLGNMSYPNSFTLKGSNLNGTAIIVGPLSNYNFGASVNGPFSDRISLSYSGSKLDTIIYIRFKPTEIKSYNGNIPITGGGTATPINLSITGTGINTPPAVITGSTSGITTSMTTATGKITDTGCSSITKYGIEYSTASNFTNAIRTTSSNLTNSNFSTSISGLFTNTKYYYRAYATNSGGTTYGNQQTFTTDTLPVTPIDTIASLEITALPATAITPTSFTANWNRTPGASKYYLDVSTKNDFIDNSTNVIIANWTFPDSSANAMVDNANSVNINKTISSAGTKDPTFDATAASTKAARATGWNDGANSKYWQIEANTSGLQNLSLSSKQRSSNTGPKNFKPQYKIGITGIWKDIPEATVTVADNYITGVLTNKILPAECNNQTKVLIRWIMTSNTAVGGDSVSSAGVSSIDDVLLTGKQETFVSGYKNLLVTDTLQSITGLSPNTTYYYRVRAANEDTISSNSNIITLTTAPSEQEPEPIPTTLQSFSGLWYNDKNIIRWTTATENNNRGFYLQRSPDSVHFQAINFTSSHAPGGNSTAPIEYTFDDYSSSTADSQFYRLAIVNLDGTSYFSDVIFIRGEKKIGSISIDGLYPNPASGNINLKVSTPVRTNITCSIIDSRGHIIKQLPLNLETGSNIFNIDITGVPPGTYHLKCIFQSFVDTRKFVVR